MADLNIIAVFIILTTGASGAEWASVPDPVVYTCKGKTVSLIWKLTESQGQEPAADIRWFFHGAFSSELVAAFTFGEFFTGKSYSGRVSQVQHSGIKLKDVRKSDEGNYTITVLGKDRRSVSHTVLLQVGDGMMTRNRVLEAVQDPVALWDTSLQNWMIRLLCGHFLFWGKPPVRIEWTLPNGETRTTASYYDGQFSLALPARLVPEGNYTCRIPRHFYPEVCIDEQHDDLVAAATVYVDEVRARLTLSEAEQGRLNIENSDLKDALKNVTAEMHYQKSLLSEQIRELHNMTFSQMLYQERVGLLSEQIGELQNIYLRCIFNYSVLDDARRDVNNTVRGSLCDKNLTRAWYRLYLDGQDAVLPDKCPPIYRCGTTGTGWLDLGGRDLPTFGQELEARVCAHYSANCCKESVPAAVRNCGSFYLYRLQAFSVCSVAHCFVKKSG